MKGPKSQILVDKHRRERRCRALGPKWCRSPIRVMFLTAFLASSSPASAQVVWPAAAGDLQDRCAEPPPQTPVSLAAPTGWGEAAVSEFDLRIRSVHQPCPARTDVDTNLGGIVDPVWEAQPGPPAEETEAAARRAVSTSLRQPGSAFTVATPRHRRGATTTDRAAVAAGQRPHAASRPGCRSSVLGHPGGSFSTAD